MISIEQTVFFFQI